MKRYLLFAGDGIYANGGWNEFVGDYDSFEEAVTALQNEPLCVSTQNAYGPNGFIGRETVREKFDTDSMAHVVNIENGTLLKIDGYKTTASPYSD